MYAAPASKFNRTIIAAPTHLRKNYGSGVWGDRQLRSPCLPAIAVAKPHAASESHAAEITHIGYVRTLFCTKMPDMYDLAAGIRRCAG